MSKFIWRGVVNLAVNNTCFALVNIVTFFYCYKRGMFSCRPFRVRWSWRQRESEEEAKDRQKKSNYTGNIFLLTVSVSVLFPWLRRGGGFRLFYTHCNRQIRLTCLHLYVHPIQNLWWFIWEATIVQFATCNWWHASICKQNNCNLPN